MQHRMYDDELARLESKVDQILEKLGRLEPLIDALEHAAPLFAAMAPSDGKDKPSPFKLAMAAARLARDRE